MDTLNYESINIYEVEKQLSKGSSRFLQYLDVVYSENGVDSLIKVVKISGILTNIFNNIKLIETKDAFLNRYYGILNKNELEKLEEVLKESQYIMELVDLFFNQRDEYFINELGESYVNHISDYILTLEHFLRTIRTKRPDPDDVVIRAGFFDAAVESSGMILKHFIHKGYQFKVNKSEVTEEIIVITERHIYASMVWNELERCIDYWKYSKLSIFKYEDSGKYTIIIDDEMFEINELISNARFINLKFSWNMSDLEDYCKQNSSVDKQTRLEQRKHTTDLLYARLYFGSLFLDDQVDTIPLLKWIFAYQIIVELSKEFLNYSSIPSLKLKSYCICKTKKQWKDFFKSKSIKSREFEIIFEALTFNARSQDLVDCPFLKVDDKYIIIPSLVANAEIARALASNFHNRRVELSFKGVGFEERSIAGIKNKNISSNRLYKRDNDTEYECDIAFVIDNNLFFVECKAHVQPYTIRQHTTHLSKLKQDTEQLIRISNYFKNQLSYVRESLKIPEDYVINNVHNILLTTSMIGVPLKINDVYIVDESAFFTFLNRSKPSIVVFANNTSERIQTNQFNYFEGDITADKLLEYIQSPSYFHIHRDMLEQKTIDLDHFTVTRYFESVSLINVGKHINEKVNKVIKDKFNETELDSIIEMIGNNTTT